jgi:hypothetical protein
MEVQDMTRKKARKTVEVANIRMDINKILAEDESKVSEETKKELCFFLERLLLDTGNYHGYNNVDWLKGGFNRWWNEGQPDFPEKQKYIGREYSRMYY